MFNLPALFFCLLLPLCSAPTLDSGTVERLKTVVDGQDTLGEGFAALVEDVTRWEENFLAPNDAILGGILREPVLARGLLFSLHGMAEQGKPLSPPWGGIEEWFIRDANGELFCLYIVGDSKLKRGTKLEVPARFYKTIEMEGRDKRSRMYPTFVTSSIVFPSLADSSEAPFLFILLPMVFLGAIIVFTLSRMSKKNKGRSRTLCVDTDEVLDAVNQHVGDLPEEPSKALAAMYEQSEAK